MISKKYKGFLGFVFLLLLSFSAVDAQVRDTCPAFVTVALETVNETCSETSRNQTCYGNVAIEATPREGLTTDFKFTDKGDIVGLGDVDKMTMAALDLAGEAWGVALMKVQANIPDTLPGQNVTFLVFGDVLIDNLSETSIEVPMSATGNVNIRLRPTTSSNNIIGSLSPGQEVVANGILADKSWIRIKYTPDSRTNSGWVAADFLSTTADLSALEVVSAGAPSFGPMQAFYFTTGIGQPACVGAPQDGIVVQTPKGVGRVNMNANGVDISLGSTAFLKSSAETGLMSVYMLEGIAVLTYNGVSQTVPAGTVSHVSVDGEGWANGNPQFPQPYNLEDLEGLPVDVALPEQIEVAPPIAPEIIEEAVEEAVEELVGTPDFAQGLWQLSRTVTASDDGSGSEGAVCSTFPEGNTDQTTIFISKDTQNNLYADSSLMTNVSAGTYIFTSQERNGTTTQFSVTFVSPYEIIGSFTHNSPSCNAEGSLRGLYLAER